MSLHSLLAGKEDIGVGAQHRVFRDGERVIKVPHLDVPGFRETLRGSMHALFVDPFVRQTPDVAKRNSEWGREYFEPYMAPSEVIADAHRSSYYILQDYVPYTRMTPEIVQSDPQIEWQLRDIVFRNRDLMREKEYLLDVLGFDPKSLWRLLAYGEGRSDNVVIGADRRLKIIDDGMFPIPGSKDAIPLHSGILRFIQERNMRSYLGRPTGSDRPGWFYHRR